MLKFTVLLCPAGKRIPPPPFSFFFYQIRLYGQSLICAVTRAAQGRRFPALWYAVLCRLFLRLLRQMLISPSISFLKTGLYRFVPFKRVFFPHTAFLYGKESTSVTLSVFLEPLLTS
jgi:hypothetical protein